MLKLLQLALLLIIPMGLTVARAETVEEANSLLDSALALIKTKGLESATNELNAGGAWNKGSLYITVARFDGQMLAHSRSDKLRGRNMLHLKDVNGTPFIEETIAAVKANGTARLQIRWANPITKKVQDATLVARRIPAHDAYIGSIVFK